MRKNFFKIVTIILSIIFVILAVTLICMKVVNGKEKEDRDLLLSKIMDELNFIDYNVIDAMNKLNNISVTRYKMFTKTVNNSNKENEGQGEGEQQQSTNEENSQNNQPDNSEGKSSAITKEDTANKSSSKKQTEKEVELKLTNSLTETDNQETDWDTVTNIYENLLSTWPTTQQDLKKAGIEEEYLENINVDLNGVAQSILNKDKNSCLVNLYNLYSQIPTYTKIISNDEYTTNLYSTKTEILNAYSMANADNKWSEISASIKSATSQFEKIVDSKNEEKEKSNLEKIYSMLKNFESAVALNDKNIFYMQYKNIMQEISNL